MNNIDYEPDFEISKRYIDYSAELLRLSLLAITGIFYLLFNKDDFKAFLIINSYWIFLILLSFTACCCFALLHRFYATDALSYLIAFLRNNKSEEKKGYIRCLKLSERYVIVCQYSFGFALCISILSLFFSL
jgi:hypothetical protein